MEEIKPNIGDGTAAVLVYDKSIDGEDEFSCWLRDQGFKSWMV